MANGATREAIHLVLARCSNRTREHAHEISVHIYRRAYSALDDDDLGPRTDVLMCEEERLIARRAVEFGRLVRLASVHVVFDMRCNIRSREFHRSSLLLRGRSDTAAPHTHCQKITINTTSSYGDGILASYSITNTYEKVPCSICRHNG